MFKKKVLTIGAKYAQNEYEKNNLLITNFAFSIGLVTSGVFTLFLLFSGDYSSALVIFSGFSLCVAGIVLNSQGYYSLALIAACSATGVVIPIHNWFYPNTGVLAYLLTACVIVSFLSAQKPALRRVLIIYTFVALLSSLATIIFIHNGIHINESNRIPIMINIIGALSSLVVAVSFFSKQLQLQQNKFESLNEIKNKLIAVLAHDIRGPLNNLVHLSDLINNHELDKEESEAMMKTLIREIKSAANLLDDVLIWIKSQIEGLETNKVLFELSALCEKVIDENKIKAELKGIKIEFKGFEHQVFADKDMIALALRNLLTNAIKFSPKATGKILVELRKDGNHPTISITDNGKGLSKSEIEKIRELKSFTNSGSSDEKGFGIGLFLTNEFLRQNDAELNVENAQNGGAQFSIKFSNQ
jgi:signal transduction histidine kinase